jgi:hypothetical protein
VVGVFGLAAPGARAGFFFDPIGPTARGVGENDPVVELCIHGQELGLLHGGYDIPRTILQGPGFQAVQDAGVGGQHHDSQDGQHDQHLDKSKPFFLSHVRPSSLPAGQVILNFILRNKIAAIRTKASLPLSAEAFLIALSSSFYVSLLNSL